MKLLVSDMGGVLYSYDRLFDQAGHQRAFDEVIKRAWLEDSDLKPKLEAEYQAVVSGELMVYPMESGLSNLGKNLTTCKVVIVSTALSKTSRYILEKFGLGADMFDIYDMSDFGSKKDKNAWKKIFGNYGSIDYVVEDGKENLEAAGEAAEELGFEPELFINMPVV